ncbi:MAG: hypothetical protein AB8B85_01175 [Paracoccaceae bacterium]
MSHMELAIIGPSFFGYLEDLTERFHARGIGATFYDERPSNSISTKAFLRVAPAAVKARRTADWLARTVQSVIEAGTTHALLISPEIVTPDAVRRLQAAGIKVTRYGFDSVRNKRGMQDLDPLMDRVASFDPEDCAQLGYDYIPLYSAAPRRDPAPDRACDFFYCTTMHSHRPQMVARLKAIIARRGWSSGFLLFYHSRPLWLAIYLRHPQVWGLVREIATTPFSKTDIARATETARVVFDIHHGGQSGLTMRTFEALSLGAVLLTTNTATFEYLPKCLQNRLVHLDMDNPEASMEAALATRPGPLTEAELHYLSVERFMDQVFALATGAEIPQPDPVQTKGDIRPATTPPTSLSA